MTPFDFMMDALYIMAGVACLLLTILGLYLVGTGISNDTRKDRVRRAIQNGELFDQDNRHPLPSRLSDCLDCLCADCGGTVNPFNQCEERPCSDCMAGHRHKPKEGPPCDNFYPFYETAK